MSWYALHVRSSFEARVQSFLNFAGFQDFCPRYSVRSADRRKDRPSVLERPLFTGYVFADFDAADNAQYQRIVQLPGVLRIVGYEQPVVISDREIESVKRVAECPFPVRPEPSFGVNEGDQVRVVKGPLRGVEGTVLYTKARPRLVVWVNMLGQGASVEVDGDWLELLAEAKKAA